MAAEKVIVMWGESGIIKVCVSLLQASNTQSCFDKLTFWVVFAGRCVGWVGGKEV